ncbi:DUF2953 domain-containing protein [Ornithinibacillus caprae]|uniref:DUF2953 domain-containing protein n=1 Tax=Ornithinibacillus caprae TaxID=2678566 RepID=UPI0031B63DD9
MWVIIAIIILILMTIMLLSKMYISFCYTYKKHAHEIHITVKIYQLRLFSKEWCIKRDEDIDILDLIGELDASSGMEGFKNSFKYGVENMKIGLKIIKRLLAKSYFHELNWQTTIGTGNASSTGILTGGMWTLKGSIIALLNELGNVTGHPIISINPNFQMKQLESKIDCIVSIRIGQAIYTVFKAVRKIPVKKEAYIS